MGTDLKADRNSDDMIRLMLICGPVDYTQIT